MKDLLLDTNNNLVITNGQLMFTTDTITYAAQKIQIVLRTFLGEYFLDITIGIDYFGIVLIKNPSLVTIEALIKKQIMGVAEVKSITAFNLSFNTSARYLTINFIASLSTGQSTGQQSIQVPF
jgi:hypothetical protein